MPDGAYEILKMPFGMVNFGTTLVPGYQHDFFLRNGKRSSYVDDMLIHTNTWKNTWKWL